MGGFSYGFIYNSFRGVETPKCEHPSSCEFTDSLGAETGLVSGFFSLGIFLPNQIPALGWANS